MASKAGTRRITKSGAKVKFDSNPLNDYIDGYNAARRWAKKQFARLKRENLIQGIIIGQLLVIIAYMAGRM